MKLLFKNFLTVDIPLMILFSQALVAFYLSDAEKISYFSENGPHEMLEAGILAIAFFVALYLCFVLKDKWLRIWTGIAALCCFYVAGEELSWGQWLFDWETPAKWAAINDQNETNLHNTSTWLDQKPRALLEIGVLIGGLIIPSLRKWAPHKLPEKFKNIYPGNEVVVTAFFALLVKISDKIKLPDGGHIFWRTSELLEMYLYHFVLVYLIFIGIRWKREGKI